MRDHYYLVLPYTECFYIFYLHLRLYYSQFDYCAAIKGSKSDVGLRLYKSIVMSKQWYRLSLERDHRHTLPVSGHVK